MGERKGGSEGVIFTGGGEGASEFGPEGRTYWNEENRSGVEVREGARTGLLGFLFLLTLPRGGGSIMGEGHWKSSSEKGRGNLE